MGFDHEDDGEELEFIAEDELLGDPPKMHVGAEPMTPAFMDWNDPEAAGPGPGAVDDRVVNEVSLPPDAQTVEFSLSSEARMLAAEISYYPPGSSAEDLSSEPQIQMDCLADSRCTVTRGESSTVISLELGDGIEHDGFVGLYLEYPAADRSDGAFFRSIAWAVHLGR